MSLSYTPKTWVEKKTKIHAEDMTRIEQGIQTVTQAVKELPSSPAASSNALTPEQFGAVGDGVADDTEALVAAMTAASEKKQPLELKSTATYRYCSYIKLPDDLTLHGNHAILLSDFRDGGYCLGSEGRSMQDWSHDIRLENVQFKCAASCTSRYILRFMRTRDVLVKGCMFECDINDYSRGCVDVYGACENIIFEQNVFRQLSAHAEGGLWVRSWTNAVDTKNIRFLNCDFYKAGGDEVLAVWGWGGHVRDVLISGCTFTEVDEEKYRKRGYDPAFLITLGQSGVTDVRVENCMIRASRCHTVFKMNWDGTHAVVDNCDIYLQQADDIPKHDMTQGANPTLALGNGNAQKSIITNCRVYIRGDTGRRLTYKVGSLRNNYFDVELGSGPASSVEVIGNVFKGRFEKQLFNDCNIIRDNTVEAELPDLGLFSGGGTVEGNQYALTVTSYNQGGAIFNNNWGSGTIKGNHITLTCTSEDEYTIRKYNFPYKGTEYIEDNIVTIKGPVEYDSPHLSSVLAGTIYRKNNYFNGIREALFECTGVSFETPDKTEQYKKYAQLKVSITPENCTDPIIYTWANADGAVLDMGDGKYRPVKNGAATVTVNCGAFHASQTIMVALVPVACESLRLSRTNALCAVDTTTYLKAFASPYWTTDDIVWSSDDEEMATVTQDGTVTLHKTGSTTIRATCGSQSVTCALTIVEQSEMPVYTSGEWALDSTVAYIALPNLAEEHTVYATFDIDTSCVGNSEEIPLITSLLSGQTGQEAIRLAFGADGTGYKTVRWHTTDVIAGEDGNTTLYSVPYASTGVKDGEPATIRFVYRKEGVANPSGAVVWGSETSSVKAAPDSGYLSFNVQTSASDAPVTDYTSGAALAAALASGSVHATKATGFKLKELIVFANSSYTTLDDIKKYREGAEIDLRFDADGNAVNAGTAGNFIIAGKGGEIVPVSSVTLNKTALSLAESGSDTLTASVLPADASEKTVTWSVSPEGVVTLSGSTGNSVTVTAAAAGECTITAAAGGKTVTCAVTVTESASGDSDPVPVFSLPETTFVPSEQKVIDTGIKPFESADGAKDYTIIIAQRSNTTDTSTSRCLLHCMEETSPYPGLSLSHGKSAYTISAFGRRADQLLSTAVGYTTVNTVIFAIRVSAKQVWAKAYVYNTKVFIESKGWIPLNYAAVDKTLLIGGYQTSDGVKGHFWDGTVNWCKIYDKLLDETVIDSIMTGQTS